MTGPMTCQDGVRLLMDYTEGLLPTPTRRSIEKHVGGCRRCQGFVRSYGETPRILRAATESPMPARVGQRLRRVVAALPDRTGRRGGGRP